MSIERLTWVPVPDRVAFNGALKRRVETLDKQRRYQLLAMDADGVARLTYPLTLVMVNTTGGAVAVMLPAAATVLGYRVSVVREGANSVTVDGDSVPEYAGFISTGAAWRRVA